MCPDDEDVSFQPLAVHYQKELLQDLLRSSHLRLISLTPFSDHKRGLSECETLTVRVRIVPNAFVS